MTEIVLPDSGEVISYEPMTPVQIEWLITDLSARLERSNPVIKDMWEARYAAERALKVAHAEAVLASGKSLAMEKRAEADLATIELREAFDVAKAALHTAEDLQRALRAKLSAMQSVNKSVMAAYGVPR